jgi:hypothetical protein
MLNAVLILPAGALTAVNGATGVSDIEGKAAREAVSEWGQRASFNGANGMSEQPLVAAVPATPKLGEGRSAAEFAPRRWPVRPSRRVVSLCPKQLP